jgi:hypothetical protein
MRTFCDVAPPNPFAIVADQSGAQILISLNAEDAGLRPGQPLRDASALCPGLLTRVADPLAQAKEPVRKGPWPVSLRNILPTKVSHFLRKVPKMGQICRLTT